MMPTPHPSPETGPPQVPQYGRAAILALWSAATIPMGLLTWVIAPAIERPAFNVAWFKVLVALSTVGLAWQFVLTVLVLIWEQRSFDLTAWRRALWLQRPRRPEPSTTREVARRRYWWVLVPMIVAFTLESAIPELPSPASRDFASYLDSNIGRSFLHGNVTWFVVIVALCVFNTVIGEELWFRGVLLPRMASAFGSWDWAVNGVLFAAYHVHMPWAMPSIVLDGPILAYPTKRFRSTWLGIIVHSVQSVVILLVVGAIVW